MDNFSNFNTFNNRQVLNKSFQLTCGQLLSQIGVEKYTSPLILQIFGDLMREKLIYFCHLLKKCTQEIDHISSFPSIIFTEEVTDSEYEKFSNVLDDKESENFSSKFLDSNENDYTNNNNENGISSESESEFDQICHPIIKSFMNLHVGKLIFSMNPCFRELSLYLSAQSDWIDSMMDKIIATHRDDKDGYSSAIPPEPLLSIFQTLPKINIADASKKEKLFSEIDSRSEKKNTIQQLTNLTSLTSNITSLKGSEDLLPFLPKIPENYTRPAKGRSVAKVPSTDGSSITNAEKTESTSNGHIQTMTIMKQMTFSQSFEKGQIGTVTSHSSKESSLIPMEKIIAMERWENMEDTETVNIIDKLSHMGNIPNGMKKKSNGEHKFSKTHEPSDYENTLLDEELKPIICLESSLLSRLSLYHNDPKFILNLLLAPPSFDFSSPLRNPLFNIYYTDCPGLSSSFPTAPNMSAFSLLKSYNSTSTSFLSELYEYSQSYSGIHISAYWLNELIDSYEAEQKVGPGTAAKKIYFTWRSRTGRKKVYPANDTSKLEVLIKIPTAALSFDKDSHPIEEKNEGTYTNTVKEDNFESLENPYYQKKKLYKQLLSKRATTTGKRSSIASTTGGVFKQKLPLLKLKLKQTQIPLATSSSLNSVGASIGSQLYPKLRLKLKPQPLSVNQPTKKIPHAPSKIKIKKYPMVKKQPDDIAVVISKSSAESFPSGDRNLLMAPSNVSKTKPSESSSSELGMPLLKKIKLKVGLPLESKTLFPSESSLDLQTHEPNEIPEIHDKVVKKPATLPKIKLSLKRPKKIKEEAKNSDDFEDQKSFESDFVSYPVQRNGSGESHITLAKAGSNHHIDERKEAKDDESNSSIKKRPSNVYNDDKVDLK